MSKEPLKPSKVVIVDDNKIMCLLFRSVFKQINPNYLFSIFCNGKDALDYLEKAPR